MTGRRKKEKFPSPERKGKKKTSTLPINFDCRFFILLDVCL